MKNRKFWKIFLLALLTPTALTGGGVALYLYLTKPTKPIDKKPNDDKGDKNNNELETKWYNFIKKVKNNNNELLNSINWPEINEGEAWQNLIKTIQDKLKEAWSNAGLGSENSDLKISFFDGEVELKGPIDKNYIDTNKTISIKLAHKKHASLEAKQIDDITINLTYSLTAKWKHFTDSVKDNNLLKGFPWRELEAGETWENLIKLIQDKLKDAWSNAGLGSENSDLKISFFDGEVELKGPIDKNYIDTNKTISIKLAHKKHASLEAKQIDDITINLTYSLTAKWKHFTDSVKDNNLLKGFPWRELEAGETWENLIKLIQDKLKDAWSNAGLGSENSDLKISFFDGEVELKGPIDKNYIDTNKTISIKLAHKKHASLEAKQIDDITINLTYSLTAKWKHFTDSVKDNNLLKGFPWRELEAGETWENLIKLIQDKLKDAWSNAGLGSENSDLKISFFDGEVELKGPIDKNYIDTNKTISIKLAHKKHASLEAKQIDDITINLTYSLTAKWKHFTDSVKDNNLLTGFPWRELEAGETWENLIKLIQDKLKDAWSNAGLGSENSDLKISFFDGEVELKGPIDKNYIDTNKTISIKLAHKKHASLEAKQIDDITINLTYSLTAKWKHFTDSVKDNNLLTGFPWRELEAGETWENLIKLIQDKLKDAWSNAGLGSENSDLKISFFDGEVELKGPIDKNYIDTNKTISIKLAHKKHASLEAKQIDDITINLTYSLTAKWKHFTDSVKDNNLLTGFPWRELEAGETWENLIKLIQDKLKEAWSNAGLGSENSDLKISFFDGEVELKGPIDKNYIDTNKTISIKLAHKKHASLEAKQIDDITINLTYSLTAKWKHFTDSVKDNNLLKGFPWRELEAGETWENLIKLIQDKLKDAWSNAGLGSENSDLKISFFDGEVELKGPIDKNYIDTNKTISIKLAHKKHASLEAKQIDDITINLTYSLTAKWKHFTDSVKDNNLLTGFPWRELEAGETWENLIKLIQDKLKEAWSNAGLGSENSDLKISFFDGEVELKGPIDKNYIDTNKTISIKLAHKKHASLEAKQIDDITINLTYSLTAKWKHFTDSVKDNNLLTGFPWRELEAGETWENLIKLIQDKLKDAWSNAGLGSENSDLKISFFDGEVELKGPIDKNYIDTNKTISIKLAHKKHASLEAKQIDDITINLTYSLTAKWKHFTDSVKDNNLLKGFPWRELEAGETWENLIKLIQDKLKDAWSNAGLGSENSDLKISFFDGEVELKGPIDKNYIDTNKTISIKLAHKKHASLEAKQIDDITINLTYSLTAKWKHFTDSVKDNNLLTGFPWRELEAGETWENLIKLIQDKLKDAWSNAGLGSENSDLKISFFDGEVELKGPIDKNYIDTNKTISIKLAHKKHASLEAKQIDDITINLTYSLTAKWKHFTDSVKDNNLLTGFPWRELEAGETWENLIKLIQDKLKDAWSNAGLGSENSDLKISFFDGEVELKGPIDKNYIDTNKTISIKLAHKKHASLEAKQIDDITINLTYSLTAKWKHFTDSVKDNNLLKGFPWRELEAGETWENLIKLIQDKLKDAWSNAGLGSENSDLKISFFDGEVELKGPIDKNYIDTNKTISIKLAHKKHASLEAKQIDDITINLTYSLTAKWKHFTDSVKDNNLLTGFPWRELEAGETWENLIKLIQDKLKEAWSNAGLGSENSDLKISFFDGEVELKGPIDKNYIDTNKTISIKLAHKKHASLEAKQIDDITINLTYSLTAKWKHFTDSVKDNNLLKGFPWRELEAGETWENLIKLIQDKLKDAWSNAGLGSENSDLKISFFDGEVELKGPIDKNYIDTNKTISIKLAHKKHASLEAKQIDDITINLTYSLTAKWKHFTDSVKDNNLLTGFPWRELEAGETWENLIKLIQDKLKEAWSNAGLGSENSDLKISFFDGEVELKGPIDKNYIDTNKTISIKLAHKKHASLEAKQIDDITINLTYSLTAKWKHFTDSVKDNNLLKGFPWRELEAGETWENLIKLIQDKLKEAWSNAGLGSENSDLKISFFDGEVELKGPIDKNYIDTNKTISIKLAHKKHASLEAKQIDDITINLTYSLTAKWKHFTDFVKDNNLLKGFPWRELEAGETWENLIKLIQDKLKDAWSNAGLGSENSDLKISFFDGEVELKGPIDKNYIDTNKTISIKLAHKKHASLEAKQIDDITINLTYSLTAKWKHFTDSVKDNNLLTGFPWRELEAGETWENLIKLIQDKLKDAWSNAGLGSENSDLKISFFDGEVELKGPIDKNYIDTNKTISIKLAHKKHASLEAKQIDDITINLTYSLTAKWKHFTDSVKDNNLLTGFPWRELEAGETWENLIKLIQDKLKEAWSNAGLGSENSDLKISFFDGEVELKGPIDKNYIDTNKTISIKLAHKKHASLEAKQIDDITINLTYSLTAKWKHFTDSVKDNNLLKGFPWRELEAGETWENLIKLIQDKLKDAWSNAGLGSENSDLKISFFDGEVELKGPIDKNYIDTNKTISIKLAHKKHASLEAKQIDDITINLTYSLTAKWKHFTDSVKDNNLLTGFPWRELEAGETWENLIKLIQDKLKEAWSNAGLGSENSDLKISFFDGEVELKGPIDKNYIDTNKTISIKLAHKKHASLEAKQIDDITINLTYSLTAKWKHFTDSVKDNNLLKGFPWRELEAGETWENLIKLIQDKLKEAWSNAGLGSENSDLKISFFDGEVELKGPIDKNYIDTNKTISIKLAHKKHASLEAKQIDDITINLTYSLTAKWKHFTDSVKDNNLLKGFPWRELEAGETWENLIKLIQDKLKDAWSNAGLGSENSDLKISFFDGEVELKGPIDKNYIDTNKTISIKLAHKKHASLEAKQIDDITINLTYSLTAKWKHFTDFVKDNNLLKGFPWRELEAGETWENLIKLIQDKLKDAWSNAGLGSENSDLKISFFDGEVELKGPIDKNYIDTNKTISIKLAHKKHASLEAKQIDDITINLTYSLTAKWKHFTDSVKDNNLLKGFPWRELEAGETWENLIKLIQDKLKDAWSNAGLGSENSDLKISFFDGEVELKGPIDKNYIDTNKTISIKLAHKKHASLEAKQIDDITINLTYSLTAKWKHFTDSVKDNNLLTGFPWRELEAGETWENLIKLIQDKLKEAWSNAGLGSENSDLKISFFDGEVELKGPIDKNYIDTNKTISIKLAHKKHASLEAKQIDDITINLTYSLTAKWKHFTDFVKDNNLLKGFPWRELEAGETWENLIKLIQDKLKDAWSNAGLGSENSDLKISFFDGEVELKGPIDKNYIDTNKTISIKLAHKKHASLEAKQIDDITINLTYSLTAKWKHFTDFVKDNNLLTGFPWRELEAGETWENLIKLIQDKLKDAWSNAGLGSENSDLKISFFDGEVELKGPIDKNYIDTNKTISIKLAHKKHASLEAKQIDDITINLTYSLTAKWKHFTDSVKDNNLLTGFPWRELEAGETWENLIKLIQDKLKEAWSNAGLGSENSDLKISFFDGEVELKGPIDKNYIDTNKTISIKLAHKKHASLEAKQIDDITINLTYSLTAKWKHFTDSVKDNNLLKGFPWRELEAGETWENLIKLIQDKLKDAWSNAGLGSENSDLKISFFDGEVELKGPIDKNYIDTNKTISIKLAHKKHASLEAKQIDDITINLTYSLTAKWKHFTDSVKDNNLLTGFPWRELEAGETWENLIKLIQDKLKEAWSNAGLGSENSDLKISFFDGEVELKGPIDKNYIDTNKTISIKLAHKKHASLEAKQIDDITINLTYSLTAKWKHFTDSVKDNNLLKGFPWRELEAGETWENLIKLIQDKLKEAWSNAGLGSENSDLKISFFDGEVELKGPIDKNYIDTNKTISIKLAHKKHASLEAKQIDDITINLTYSLTAKWKHFTDSVKDNNLLKGFPWRELEAGETWENLIKLIQDKLKDAWSNAGLGSENSDLKISFFDGEVELKGPIDKNYIDTNKTISIKLAHKKHASLEAKQIDDITINLTYSLTAKWKHFTDSVKDNNLLKGFPWRELEAGETWENLIKLIQDKLKDAWSNAGLGSENSDLKISFFDGEVELKGPIDKNYIDTNKTISIKLAHKKHASLEAKQIDDITINLTYSLTAKWKHFTDSVKDNNLLTGFPWRELEAGETWENLIKLIQDKLKEAWSNAGLGSENSDLKISFFDGEVELKGPIDKNYIDTNKTISIKLAHKKHASLEAKQIDDITINLTYSLTAKWKHFTDFVKDNNLLKGFPWRELEAGETWENLIKLIQDKLKDAWSNAGLGSENSDLKISFFDGEVELKGPIDKNYIDTNKTISIKLAHKKHASLEAKQIDDITINLTYSLTAKWKHFTDSVKDNNLLKGFPWRELEAGETWENLIKLIQDKLKDAWSNAGLGSENSDLKISFFDGEVELKGPIDKNYIDTNKTISIKLAHKKHASLEAKQIDDITINLTYSLTAKWKHFTDFVKDNNLLKGFPWRELEAGETWENLIKLIQDKLKDAWSNAGLGSENSDLKISFFDGEVELKGPIDKNYIDTNKTISIKLAHKKHASLEAKQIDDITINLTYSLTAKWKHFTDSVKDNNLLKGFPWRELEAGETWENLIKLIQDKLKDAWSNAGLGSENSDLKISFFDGEVELKGPIDKNYIDTNKTISIKLAHKKHASLEAKQIDDITINLTYSLTAKWKHFTDYIESGGLLKSLADLIKIEDGQDWKDVIQAISDKLAKLWENNGLENIKDNLIITLYGKDGELTGVIPNSYSNNKQQIKIKLSYKDKPKLEVKEFENIDIQLAKSLATRWTNFIASISKDGKLNDLSLINFTNKNKWDDVLKAIREKLAIKFKEIFGNDSDLKIDLQDEKGGQLDLNNQIGKNSYLPKWKIKVKLTHKKLGDNNSKSLDLVISTPLDINELKTIVDNLLKDFANNNKDEFKKNFIKAINEVEKYKKYNFELGDFNFDFDLAKIGDNKVKVRVTITSNNKNKVKGEVKGNGGNYAELKLDLNKLKEAINYKIETENPTYPETFNNIIKDLLKREAYKNYNINLEDELIIHFIPPENNKLGSFSIEAKEDSLNAKGKTNGEIAVYGILLFDLSNLKTIVEKLIKDINNNDEATFRKNFIKELNKPNSKYKDYKFVDDDFDFDFNPATKGNNKLRLTIKPKNKNKVKRSLEIKDHWYDQYRIDLQDQDFINKIRQLINKEQPDTKQDFISKLQDWFNNGEYKEYNVNVEEDLNITSFIAPKFGVNNNGSFSIESNNITKFKNSISNIDIAYYKKYKIDFSKFKEALHNEIRNEWLDRNELNQFINDVLENGEFNKYKDSKIINLDDLDITTNLNKPSGGSAITLDINVSLKQEKHFNVKLGAETQFKITLTYQIRQMWKDLEDELTNPNALDGLKNLLEEKETYKHWEEVKAIVEKWLKESYSTKYKYSPLLKYGDKWEMDFFDPKTGYVENIIDKNRKDFDGHILLKYYYGKEKYETGWIPFKFKISRKSMFEKYAFHLDSEFIGTLTYKFDYYFDPHHFIKDLEEEIESFFKRKKLLH